ncbi:MAG: FAD-dependent monooxygenase [Saprospiraceae bacterium]|nr:FAD-dependent monooxygenase [Saprospiraceae bacterium]
MSSINKVLIVGGGLGGLSLGIALRRAGMDAEIVELQKEFNVYGVGIIQQANALRALDTLGVADEAMRRGSPYGNVKMCAPTGHQFAEIGMPPLGRYPTHNGISRRILHDVLYEAAVKNGVTFRMGLTVSEIENEGTRVGVKFTDGTEGSYQLVVGADGVNSKVRTLVFGEQHAHYVGSSVWRYAFKRPAELETGYMYFGKKSKIGLIPMTADMIYMFVVTAEGDDNPFIPENELVPRLKAYVSQYPAKMVADLVDEITDPKGVIYRPLETLVMSAPWYKNRVVMIGDAAHSTIPQLGSGAALAIEDAVVLAEELARDQSVENVLDNYMARRYNRCKMVCDASVQLAEWERMEWQGIPLPEGANMGALMGKTLGALAAPI